MPLTLTRTVEPAALPVLWAEAQAHMRLDGTTEQTYVETLLGVATRVVEEETQRALITQTWALRCDDFPVQFELPRPPLASVSSIAYTDENGDAQTLAASVYQVDLYSLSGRVTTAVDQVWPNTYSGAYNTVVVTYTAGYGAAGSSVPLPLRQAILLLTAHWFEHREAVGPSMAELPMAVKYLIAPFRTMTQR